jgi:hypothetical protein
MLAIVLQNTETIDPEISLTDISDQANRVIDDGWQLIT